MAASSLCVNEIDSRADRSGKPALLISAWAVWALAYATWLVYMFDLIAYYNRMQDHYGAFDHQNRPRDLAPDRHVNRLARRHAEDAA